MSREAKASLKRDIFIKTEGAEGASCVDIWRENVPGRGTGNAKALR